MKLTMTLLLLALLLSPPARSQTTDPLSAALAAYHAADVATAAPALRQLADEGSATAQYYLGRLYYYPEYAMPQDYTQAATWFLRAAVQGHAEAQYKLGGCYLSGRGVKTDDERAVYWLLHAGSQLHGEALNILGALLASGRGLPRNRQLGYALQLLAAEKGSSAAQENLAAKTPGMSAGEIEKARQQAARIAVDGQSLLVLLPAIPASATP